MRDANRLEVTARAEGSHFWFLGLRRFLASCLGIVAGGRTDLDVLDCGCGTGGNLPLLGRFGRVHAIELDPIGIAHARRRTRRLARADIYRLPFGDGTFDLVVSFDVFQMLADDRQALGEMARVTRPGGVVVVSAAALEALRGEHSEVWNEERRYTVDMARRLVAQAGLDLVRVSYLFASLVPVIYVVRRAQRRLRRESPNRHADMSVPPAPLNRLLTAVLFVEAALARWVPMPFGSSILLVARRPPS